MLLKKYLQISNRIQTSTIDLSCSKSWTKPVSLASTHYSPQIVRIAYLRLDIKQIGTEGQLNKTSENTHRPRTIKCHKYLTVFQYVPQLKILNKEK